jgi:hypothetical protein
MNDIDRLCALCAEEGVSAALRALPPDTNLAALADACLRHAERAREQGSQAQADRLCSAAQYLAYLELPYKLD